MPRRRGPFQRNGERRHTGPLIDSYLAKRTNDQVEPEVPPVEPSNKRSHEEDAQETIGAPLDPSNATTPSSAPIDTNPFETIGAPLDPSNATTPLDKDEELSEDESSDEEFVVEDDQSSDDEPIDEELWIGDDESSIDKAREQELAANSKRQDDGGLTEGTMASKVLRVTIQMLKAQAETQGSDTQDNDRLMIRLFAKLLRDSTTDELVDLYSKAFTPQLIELFERETWSLDALLTLLPAEGNDKVGVYLIVASHIRSLQAKPEAGYVGSASGYRGIHGRTMGHKTAIKGNPLPNNLLYSFVQDPEIETHHLTLLHFSPEPKHRVYILLAEALGTIWFGTLEEPGTGKNDRFYNTTSFEMVRRIRNVLESQGLAPMEWKPLNRAWQLLQGYPKSPEIPQRVCSNPHCKVASSETNPITYHGRPNWPEEIRGQWICDNCYEYNRNHPTQLRVPGARPKRPRDPNPTCANPDCPSKVVRDDLRTCKPEWDAGLAGKKICGVCAQRFRRRVKADLNLTCANPDCVTKVAILELRICKPEWDAGLAGKEICKNCSDRLIRHAKALMPKEPNLPGPKLTCANPDCVTKVAIHELRICKPEWDAGLAGQKICKSCWSRFYKRVRRRAKALMPKEPNLPGPKLTCANPDCVTKVAINELRICKPERDAGLAGQKICKGCWSRFYKRARRRAKALMPKDPNLPGPKAKK